MKSRRGRQTLYLANPAFEDVLAAELQRWGLRSDSLAAGVRATASGRLIDPCFARQVLPAAQSISGTGPSDFADAVLASLGDEEIAQLYTGQGQVFVFPPDFYRRGSDAPAPHPLTPAALHLEDILRKKIVGRAQKRGFELLDHPPTMMLQVLLSGAGQGYVSTSPLVQDALDARAWPLPFGGGRARLGPPEDAPSSAYKKLAEALLWMGCTPGADDVALDLGAAPGGWTHVALARGAKVIAYDRAELAPRLAAHPRVTHLRKDAFTEAPLDVATWLLCDIIDLPARTEALLERAVQQPQMQALVVTIKLKRPVDVEVLSRVQAFVRDVPHFHGRAKNLVHNKCEITVMLRRRPTSETPGISS